ncbi:MAG: dTDP-4-dehydrorhamnose 3,5-epimerase family protein [Candidatus Bathyarchaeota archaeon]|nr:dTDP-4-dehydrorhamnose 3,5-epimerase family protein [Candidatus Bathyarchaeota archaeon]
MLDGIRIKPIKRFPDERGFFCEIMRSDWRDLFGEDNIAQANFSYTYPDVIRAWHRHLRGQVDYFLVLRGTIKICAFDEVTSEVNEVVSSGTDLQLVRMPGHYWHGFKAVGNEPAMLVYFTTNLYDVKAPDEERRDWNDPTLIPKIVNGKASDIRVGKSWDWNYPPHK